MAKKPDDLVKELCKLKSNRNCFDCGKQGPHANVCTSFNIFVCQNCAGLHRKFTHKVKGISASTFTQKEVDELKAGGNKKAEKIWHATLEEKPHGLDLNVPSNLELFFKLCYVENKWYREPGTVVDKDKGEKKTGTLKRAPTSQTGKPELPSPSAAAQQAGNGNGVKVIPAPESTGKGTVQGSKPQPEKQQPDLMSSFGAEFTFETPSRTEQQPPLSPTHFLNSAVSSPAQVETITESSKNIAPNAEVVETLTRGFKAIMDQYKLSGLALQACVEKALADIMGASVILTPSKFANEKKPQVQASVPPTPPNTNTIMRHSSRVGNPPMSPGQGSLDLANLKHIPAPSSQHGPSENGDLIDPLAGIGTSGDTSGNPFDDDGAFGGSSPAQPSFMSNGSTSARNGTGKQGGGDIFDSPATFEQQSNTNGLGNAFGGSTTSSLGAGAFGNTAPQNGASALTMSMRGGQAPVQQQTQFMQSQFPFDASTFGGQGMVGTQMGGQMYGGLMPGFPQGGMMQQGGMMPMGYPPGTMYVMPPGYVQAGAGFTAGTQQTPFGGQTGQVQVQQQTAQTTAPQPKKPANDMFTQLNPLATK